MSEHYLDFELQIERANVEGTYNVSVVASPAGETQQPELIPFPFDARDMERLQLRLENALLRSRTRSRRALSPEEEEVRRFGQRLFEVVFQGDIRSLFYESRLLADRNGQGVRLKLRIQPPEFARLPWEFLLEPRRDEFICLSRDTPIVRYLELAQPVAPLKVTPPLCILGMVASPYDLPQLDVTLEKQRVEQALAAQRGNALKITWLAGQTVADLQRALRRTRREPYHIFHFIGHGSFNAVQDEGVLWLADQQGKAQALTATSLARLLADHHALRLVVLNACEGARGSDLDVFSSTAATLVRRGIPAVLAMQYEISDAAALLLAEWFYESLTDDLPVDTAITEARKAIALANDRSLEWGTPVLFMRAKDGRIFDVQAEGSTPSVVPAQHPQPLPTKPITPSGESGAGMAADLYNQLRSVLLDCGPFATDRELKAIFVDKRLAPWRDRLPQADNQAGRIESVIDFLYHQHNVAGENALVLLLRVLSERVNPKDACHQRLAKLADALAGETTSRRPRLQSPTSVALRNLDAPILAAPATNIAIPHIVKGAPPLEMDWCWAPGGKFTMGSKDEKPVHEVHVDGFWLARYPVTNAQYRLFIEADGYKEQRWWSKEGWQQRQQEKWAEPRFWTEKKWNGAQQPVVGVSWYEAAAFCAWATEATGERIRLPTEAEWEKGARGQYASEFPWGESEPDEKLCNFNSKVGQTTPVGQYSPQGDSPYGCADMAGNVWEWCRSRYAPYPYQSDDGRNDENGTDVRVLRGGSWGNDRNDVRCANRNRNTPHNRNNDVGFRCASTAF